MDMLFVPIKLMGLVFIPFPFIGFAFAILFYFLGKRKPSNSVRVTFYVWLFYSIYESLIKFSYICPEGCNIRIDLILIYPFLLISSSVAIIIFIKQQHT